QTTRKFSLSIGEGKRKSVSFAQNLEHARVFDTDDIAMNIAKYSPLKSTPGKQDFTEPKNVEITTQELENPLLEENQKYLDISFEIVKEDTLVTAKTPVLGKE